MTTNKDARAIEHEMRQRAVADNRRLAEALKQWIVRLAYTRVLS